MYETFQLCCQTLVVFVKYTVLLLIIIFQNLHFFLLFFSFFLEGRNNLVLRGIRTNEILNFSELMWHMHCAALQQIVAVKQFCVALLLINFIMFSFVCLKCWFIYVARCTLAKVGIAGYSSDLFFVLFFSVFMKWVQMSLIGNFFLLLSSCVCPSHICI